MAEQHPIQGLMYTAMQSIKEIVDVNTIVGDAVQTPDGAVIIPISSVKLGFAVGGSEFGGAKKAEGGQANFGGGSGGGVSISPVAFLVASEGKVRLMSVNQKTSIYDKVLDIVPSAIDKLVETVKDCKKGKKNEGDDIAKVYNDIKESDDKE
ncbi:MAG: sporulation protein YtfJ [Ruminococcaceae bacterium]|nr:sporulation protein YtfJ [Oscillospiraceae bacterium]